MAVVKRKDGRFAVTYPLNGKQKWESFGRGLDAEKKANARNEELKKSGILRGYEKQAQKKKSETFKSLALAYMDAKSITNTKSSLDNLYYSLKIILPGIGHIEAINITATTLRNYSKNRLKSKIMKRTGRNGSVEKPVKNKDGSFRTVSPSTVNRELTDIIAILNWSVREGYIIENPVKNFEKPKRDDAKIPPPTDGEVEKILERSSDHLIRALMISYYTGLRPGSAELLGLTWDNISLEKNQEWIHIISAKKRGIPERMIPLHPDFIPVLKQWEKEDDNNKHLPIIHWNKQPIKSIKKAFAGAKRRAGITRRLRLYDFRHAFASRMLKQGGDLKTTSEMLGHSRIDTTTRIYQHTDFEMYKKNISLLPGIKLKKKKTLANKIISQD